MIDRGIGVKDSRDWTIDCVLAFQDTPASFIITITHFFRTHH